MSDTVAWVSDRLHEIVGLSDKQVAEYITELARRSDNLKDFTRKLENTGAISMCDAVEAFASELWSKVPHKQGTPGTTTGNTLPGQQSKNVYRLLLDDDDEAAAAVTSYKSVKESRRKGKKSNIRSQKTTSWESDEEDAQTLGVDEGSDSDEWERLVCI